MTGVPLSRLGVTGRVDAWEHPIPNWIGGYGWTMKDEIGFLEGLGSHCGRDCRMTMSRLELLQNYRRSLDLRERWGLLDKGKLRAEVNRMIAEEGRRHPTQ